MPIYTPRPSILLLGHEDTVTELSDFLETHFDVGAASTIDDLFIIAAMIKFDVVLILIDETSVDQTDVARIRTMRRYQTVPILASSAILSPLQQALLQGIDAWIERPHLKARLLDTLHLVLD